MILEFDSLRSSTNDALSIFFVVRHRNRNSCTSKLTNKTEFMKKKRYRRSKEVGKKTETESKNDLESVTD